MIFGLLFWNEFGLEATLVKIRVHHDVTAVLLDFRRMLAYNPNFFHLI